MGDDAREAHGREVRALIDTLWVIAALLGLGWPLANGDPFLYRATNPTGGDILCGVLAMAAVLEAARRTTGWILPISAVAFLAYAFAGPMLGAIGLGGIAHRGYDLPRLIGNLYMTLEGMFGLPLDVAVTYIVLFTVYGAVLEYSGAGKFFLDFSLAIASSRGANPAAAAGRSVTLAGFLLGTVSGSGVATTVTLGSVAWPILKRVGFAAGDRRRDARCVRDRRAALAADARRRRVSHRGVPADLLSAGADHGDHPDASVLPLDHVDDSGGTDGAAGSWKLGSWEAGKLGSWEAAPSACAEPSAKALGVGPQRR